LVGYYESNPGYRIWSKEIGNVKTTRDVRSLNEVCESGFDLEDDQDKDDESIAMVTVPIRFLTARQIVDLSDYDEWPKAINQEHKSMLSLKVWTIGKRAE
jgi:hypothetical protein